ncbi:MAG: acyl-CoA dehydrogenase [Kiritimatiellia bacterium]|jgi:acyl-CoA dehydrogenase
MIGFGLTEDQQQYQDLAHQFAKDVIRPASAEHDRTAAYPWEVLRQAHDMGMLNIHVEERFGGLELGSLDGCIMAEELSWGCSGISTAMEANGLALQPVIMGGSDALKEKYVAPMIDELKLAAYALTEPGAGSDVAAMRSTAVRKGDKYILNGNKMWITNAGVADWFFVVAYTDKSKSHRGMTAFLVEASWDGVEVGKKEMNMGQRCSDTRSITFTDVEVPAENMVGTEGDGWILAMKAFDHTRPQVAAGAVGLARAAMEHAVRYSTERKTFGKPIAKHQSIQFMVAEMARDIEAARLLVWRAGWEIDEGRRNTYFASIAKAFAADSAHRIASDAVQIFGGYGFNQEYPVEKLLRDSKIFQIYEGTSQIQRIIIAREVYQMLA